MKTFCKNIFPTYPNLNLVFYRFLPPLKNPKNRAAGWSPAEIPIPSISFTGSGFTRRPRKKRLRSRSLEGEIPRSGESEIVSRAYSA